MLINSYVCMNVCMAPDVSAMELEMIKLQATPTDRHTDRHTQTAVSSIHVLTDWADEMALDESAMELELIKLQANYRHLSDFYESYKEETQRNLKKQKSDFVMLYSNVVVIITTTAF